MGTVSHQSRHLVLIFVLMILGMTLLLPAFGQGVDVWITDRTTEEPVAEAWVWVEQEGATVASGYTDANGYVSFGISTAAEAVPPPAPFWVSEPFPNPTSRSAHFVANLTATAQKGAPSFSVAVYNLLGQRVLQRSMPGYTGAYEIDLGLEGLASGVYFVSFEQGEQVVTRSLIVERSHGGGTPYVQATARGFALPNPAASAVAASKTRGGPFTLVVRKDGYAEKRVPDAFAGGDQRTVLLNPALEQVVETVTSSGADLALSNGVVLSVPPGGVTGEATVELTALAANPLFEGETQTTVHVAVASGALDQATLQFPVDNAEVAATSGVAFLHDEDDLDLVRLEGTYDEQAGLFIVPLAAPEGGKVQASALLGTYILEYGIRVSVARKSRLMEMPYYEQDGDNCWAAAWMSLVKGYKTEHNLDAIYRVLNTLNISKAAGLSWWNLSMLEGPSKSVTGITPEIKNWVSFDNMVAYVIGKLDSGYPVMVQMPTHQLMMVGYDITTTGTTTKTYLIAHDPNNSGVQTPYMRQDLDYYKKTYYDAYFLYGVYGTLVLPQAPSGSPNLTIHLPDGVKNTKGLSFIGKSNDGPNPQTIAEAVSWDHTEATGLHLNALPDKVETLKLQRVPVWNTNSTEQEVNINTILFSKKAEDDTYTDIIREYDTKTVPARARFAYDATIPTVDIKQQVPSPSYTDFILQTTLYDASYSRVGRFEVPFTYEIDWDFDSVFDASYVGKLYNDYYTADISLTIEGGQMSKLVEAPLGLNKGFVFRVRHPGEAADAYTVRVEVNNVAFNTAAWSPPDESEPLLTRYKWTVDNHPDSWVNESELSVASYEGEQVVTIDKNHETARLRFWVIPGYRYTDPNTGEEVIVPDAGGEILFVLQMSRFFEP